MKKVAIVGVEGSGKTVMLAGLGDLYTYPDEQGYFLAPKNFGTAAYVGEKIARMRKGEWPSATAGDEIQGLDWALKRSDPEARKPPETICEVSFLDFAGEVYRTAFGMGGDASLLDESEKLKRYVREADDLIVLINLRDVVSKGLCDKRVQEAMWITNSILDVALAEVEGRKPPRAAIVLSQADSYAETIKSCGGALGVLRKYLPHVANNFGWLDILATSAVDKTVLDENGFLVPSPDFSAKGLQTVMDWLLYGKTDTRPKSLPRDVRQAVDREEIRRLIAQTANQHRCCDFFFPASPKFTPKLSNLIGAARKKCNVNLSHGEAIALLDCTVFGSAKVGILFAESGICAVNDWTSTEQSGFVSWSDLAKNGNIHESASSEVHICDSPFVGINLTGSDLEPEQAVPMFEELRKLASQNAE